MINPPLPMVATNDDSPAKGAPQSSSEVLMSESITIIFLYANDWNIPSKNSDRIHYFDSTYTNPLLFIYLFFGYFFAFHLISSFNTTINSFKNCANQILFTLVTVIYLIREYLKRTNKL